MSSDVNHQIQYTELAIPKFGQLTQVAEGVYWARMPVPFHPSHINVYVLEDDNGWYIVDTGIGSDETRQCWKSIAEQYFQNKPVIGVIATHLHPDHLGLAGWLCDEWKAEFFISQREYLTARAIFKGNNRDNNWELTQFYHRCGLNPEQSHDFITNTGSLAKITSPLPISYERLSLNDELRIGKHRWQVKIGHGHSPEHVCLYSPELNILLSGDQILPKISPNISVQSLEPNQSPLTEYLDSMQHFYQLPESCLVLPSHGDPFTGLHNRLNKLIHDHKHDLELLLEAFKIPMHAIDSMPILYKRELKGIQFRLGMGEALAHLNHLCKLGKIARSYDGEGRYLYQTSVSSPLSVATVKPGPSH